MSDLCMLIEAIGISGPGLINWAAAKAVLQGTEKISLSDYAYTAPARLPSNERRRSTRITRLAFAACEDALSNAPNTDGTALGSVFASSTGDTDIIDGICRGLSAAPIALSPMQFHNSVHNASAGYWSIATGCQSASTSLSAFDATFSAGLIEAALQLSDAPERPLLLVCYDTATPYPLQAACPISQPFATAWILRNGSNARPSSIGRLELSLNCTEPVTRCGKELEAMRLANPAACALPLLSHIADAAAAQIFLPHTNGTLGVRYTPAK